jgi:hypothetical protein
LPFFLIFLSFSVPAVSSALKLLCLIHVQQHTILSALLQCTSGGSPPNPVLLAKLYQGIIEKMIEVRTTLQNGTHQYYNSLESSFHHQM